LHYFLCKNSEWLKPLKQELIQTFNCEESEIKTFAQLPLLGISSEYNLDNQYVAFSTAALINSIELKEDSISNQAKAIVAAICEKLEINQHVNIDIFSMTHKYGILEKGRSEIIKEKVTKALRAKKIFPMKKKKNLELALIQIMVNADRSVSVSILSQEEAIKYRTFTSPFVGGFNNVEDNKKAPSRAFKKIVEAQLIMGRKSKEGEVFVDLGACPGGWSYIGRQQGANIIALDRSPLREDLMADPKVEFKKADAFKFVTDEKIDWVVSDIICLPPRIMELIQTWVVAKKCRNFVFTIKFQGEADYPILKEFKELANTLDYTVILKQLNANKNEVTIMGWENSI
jgi:23S rRNA (cytidine2498-2'-O)-methyltransferase